MNTNDGQLSSTETVALRNNTRSTDPTSHTSLEPALNRHDWSTSLANKISSNEFILSDSSAEQIALELCPVPILFANQQDLSIDWSNAAAQRFLQVESNALINRVLSDFVPERELPSLWQSMADLQKGESHIATSSLSAEDGHGLCEITLAKTKRQIVVVGSCSLLSNDQENAMGTDALTCLLYTSDAADE